MFAVTRASLTWVGRAGPGGNQRGLPPKTVSAKPRYASSAFFGFSSLFVSGAD